MQKYENKNGNSGVKCFEISETFISVQFVSKSKIYKYSYSSAGKLHIEKMKELALNGKGLSSYISKHVKYKYVK